MKRYEEEGRRYTITNEESSNLSKLPTWIPSFPNDLQALQDSKMCPRGVPSRVFLLSLKISNFPFLYAEKRVKTRSCELCSPVARRLASNWRDYRDGTPLACQLALWRCIGSPVARQLASRWQADLDFEFLAFLCFFFSFVASLGFHQATNTCPPLPTQARERVEEFPCLKYTSIKLQISHKWMVFLFESLSSNICVFCYLCIIKKSVN